MSEHPVEPVYQIADSKIRPAQFLVQRIQLSRQFHQHAYRSECRTAEEVPACAG